MRVPLSILMYHRVLAAPDPLFPECLHARRFEQHLRLLRRWFRLMPLARAVAHLAEGTLPARAACLTFDHGYAEHASVALPLLQRYGVPATFFVAAGYLDGGCTWSDIVTEVVRNAPGERLNLTRSGFASYDIGCPVRRRAVIEMLLAALRLLPPAERLARALSMARRPTPTMMSSDQLLALHRAGMEIGAHPLHHSVLSTLSNAAARAEIAEGRRRIEELVRARVTLFAYPSGKPNEDFEHRHVLMLRAEGFEAAVGMARGAAKSGSDLFALPRVAPCELGSGGLLLQIAANLFARG